MTWGDGATTLPPRGVASYVYAAAGGYVVTLTAVNTRGERASVGGSVEPSSCARRARP
ncbi:MAG: hypothetical protein U1F43_04370 [Myxococcota bacterium]